MAKRLNGEGTIRQRADGRWEARLSIPNGKPKIFYGKTAAEARSKRAAAVRNVEDGLAPTPGRQTVGDYLGLWLAGARPTVKAKTWETYELNVRRVAPVIGRHQLATLTPADVRACYEQLLTVSSLRKRRGLSKRSVHQVHEMLHKALEQAVEDRMIPRNPADVTPPQAEVREMTTLTQAEVSTLFATTRGDWLHALWVVLVTTGLRVGEATALRWSDVDLDHGTLTVKRALQRRTATKLDDGTVVSGVLEFVEPKTKQSRRTVELSDHAVAVLRAQRHTQTADGLDSILVFPATDGGPLGPETVRDNLRRALTAAELPQVRVHDLRHTCATLLLEWGKHPKVVQEMLGHSTIAITLQTYSHVMPRLHREAAQAFGQLF